MEQQELALAEALAPKRQRANGNLLQGFRFGQPVAGDCMTIIITVPIGNRTSVGVELLYHRSTGKVMRMRQGKGASWRQLGLSRRQVAIITRVVRGMCEKTYERAAVRERNHELPL